MKAIDLLNKIANGEEVPKKIKVYQKIYELDEDSLNYMCGDTDWLACIDGGELNSYEVEIIEEDNKIEHLLYNNFDNEDKRYKTTVDKINEIIDYLNKED